MRRDAIFHALTISLLVVWAAVAVVVATAFSNRAPTWLAVAVAFLAVLKTWIVYNHIHLPRQAERLEFAQRLRQCELLSSARDEARARTAAVLDAVPEAVLATDSTGIIRVTNAAARELFEALETPDRLLEEAFTQGEILTLHSNALAGKAGQSQIRSNRNGGVRIYEVIARPLAENPVLLDTQAISPHFGSVIVLRDVTELALAVELKTDFVANASHELRTPLTSIRLAAETVRDAGREDPALVERLNAVILNNTRRLEELVRDLLDLSRVESPEVPASSERLVLSELVASLSPLFEEICRARRLTIESAIDSDADVLVSGPRLVELILKNLIDNATKYAFEGTSIRITAVRLPADNGGPSVIRVKVSDLGIGIPLAQQQRIFERFYQVDGARSGLTARRGTGLGLAIVKHALRRLGGTIRVESVWQQGTTMIVDLPPIPVPGPA